MRTPISAAVVDSVVAAGEQTDRGRHGIQRRLEPLRTDSQESRGTMQRIPFAQHKEPPRHPTTRVHQSRSRRRYARTLAEEKWTHGSFEYSSSSDSYADTTSSDSSEDDFSTVPVPKFVPQKVAPHHRRTDPWAHGGDVVLYPIGLLVKEKEVNDDDDEDFFDEEENNDEEEEFVDDDEEDMDDEFIDNDDEELINEEEEDESTDSDVSVNFAPGLEEEVKDIDSVLIPETASWATVFMDIILVFFPFFLYACLCRYIDSLT